jgi:AcrR family transcriptional regulator
MIDRDQRRIALAEAVWRIILRSGLDAASVRGVAAECGLSTGSVRYFFTTQKELHVFAMEALAERVSTRVEHAARVDDLHERVVAMLAELLPLTDESEREYRAWMQFVTRSMTDSDLAPVARRTFDEVRQLLIDVVEGRRELGLIDPDVDVATAAAELNALIDGLTFDLILAPHLLDRADALRILRARVGSP